MPTRNQRDFLQVGQFAAEFGINPKTIRYYEQIGLLPTARRTSAGYRLYGPKDADHLRFILKARGIGLTLNEIRDILNLRQNGKQPCEHVMTLLDEKLAGVDLQLHALTEFREELLTLQREARQTRQTKACVCGIIERHKLPLLTTNPR